MLPSIPVLVVLALLGGVSARTVTCEIDDRKFGRGTCAGDFYDLSSVWLQEWSTIWPSTGGLSNITLFGSLTGLTPSYLNYISQFNAFCPTLYPSPFNVSDLTGVDCYSTTTNPAGASPVGSKNAQQWVFSDDSGTPFINVSFSNSNATGSPVALTVSLICDPTASKFDLVVNPLAFTAPNQWVVSVPTTSVCHPVPRCGVPVLNDINGPWPMFQASRSRTGQTTIVGPKECRLGWRTFVGSPITGSPIIGPKNRTFVGTIGHQLFAVGNNGVPVWRQPVSGAVQTPMIAVATPFSTTNTTLYVPVNNALLAIHPSTHQVLWNITHPDPLATCTTAAFSDFNYYFTAVYFTCGNTLYAANAFRGHLDWTFNVSLSELPLTPVAVDLVLGTVYFGTSKALYGVNVTGYQVFYFNDTGVDGIPTISNHANSIYFNGLNNLTYSVTIADGIVQWQVPYGGGQSSSALGPNCSIILGSYSGTVYAIAADSGVTIWNVTLGGRVDSSPAIDGGNTVYIGSYDHNLYALDGATGTIKWTLKTSGAVIASPAIAQDGSVVVGSADGYLYSVTEDPSAPPCPK